MIDHSLAIFVSKLNLPVRIARRQQDNEGIYVITCLNGRGKKNLVKIGLSESFDLTQVFTALSCLDRPKDIDIIFGMTPLSERDHAILQGAAGNRYHKILSCLATAYSHVTEERRAKYEKYLNKALIGSTRKSCEPLCTLLAEFTDVECSAQLMHDFDHFYSQVRPNPRLYKIFTSRGFHDELTTRINLALDKRASSAEEAQTLSQSIAMKTSRFWKDTHLPLDST